MSELRSLVFQRGSLPILVKTIAIGTGCNQVRLGAWGYKVLNGPLIYRRNCAKNSI
jgi:hypothetical protein